MIVTKKLGLTIAGLALLTMACGTEGGELNYNSTEALVETENDPESEFDFDRNMEGSSASSEISDSTEVSRPAGTRQVIVRDGTISTSVRDFYVDGPATDIVSHGNTEHLETTVTRNDQDSAMIIVELINAKHPAFMEVGRTTSFRRGRMLGTNNSAVNGTPRFTMRACVGPQEADWEVDDDVDDIDVTVEAHDENGVLLSIETDWISAELLLEHEE